MKQVFLDFEQPIAELSQKIEELRFVQDDSVVDISEEIKRLQKKSDELTKNIFAKLTPVQVSQVSRHAQRPYTLDYIEHIFTNQKGCIIKIYCCINKSSKSLYS